MLTQGGEAPARPRRGWPGRARRRRTRRRTRRARPRGRTAPACRARRTAGRTVEGAGQGRGQVFGHGGAPSAGVVDSCSAQPGTSLALLQYRQVTQPWTADGRLEHARREGSARPVRPGWSHRAMAAGPGVPHPGEVLSLLDPARPERVAPGGWRLPAGRELAQADFAWRHRFVCLLVAAHLPVVLALGLLPLPRRSPDGEADRAGPAARAGPRRGPAGRRAVGAGAPGAGEAAPRPRRCSAARPWWCTSSTGFDRGALPLLRGRRGHRAVPGLGVVRAGRRLRAPAARADRGVAAQQRGRVAGGGRLVHAGFVLAESLVLVVFWHANEVARAEHDRLRAEQERLRAEQSSLRPRPPSCTR